MPYLVGSKSVIGCRVLSGTVNGGAHGAHDVEEFAAIGIIQGARA
jgi:hypothetical protein